MGRIFTEIERPPSALVERYRRLDLCRLVGVAPHARLMRPEIKPLLLRPVRICGPAVTVDSPAADLMMGVLATGVARAGDVVVVSPGDDFDRAAWGGGLTLSADNARYGGVVIDGAVEDADAILQCRTPVFCRGSTLHARKPDGRKGSVNVDILCGGVRVSPGDLVFGDSDGVVVIPRGELVGLIGKAEAAHADVRARIAALEQSGGVLFDRWGGLDLVGKLGVDWVL